MMDNTQDPMDTPIASDSLCLGALPARHARYRSHHTAVIVAAGSPGEREIRLDWREFNAYVNRWANALVDLGVARGDRVATVLPNGLELLATYWACAKLGAAAVPLSPLLTRTGLVSLLQDAPPRVVVTRADAHVNLDDVRRALPPDIVWVRVDAGPDDEAAGYRAFGRLHAEASDAEPQALVAAGDMLTLMYTSGTTGMPKPTFRATRPARP
jgi:acyl-coenzyme A synthetase/AMP-(fatty) acid ligase